jgi:hypothetical protein
MEPHYLCGCAPVPLAHYFKAFVHALPLRIALKRRHLSNYTHADAKAKQPA